jgi:uncharacterized protein (DUF2336 family)
MKSSAYPPLDGLVDLACRDGVDIRPTLLRVLTDLYVQKPKHSAEEETQYAELALGLIEVVDAPTRAVVTATLSNFPGAPAAVLQKLGGRELPLDFNAPIPNEAKTDDLVEMFFAAAPNERRLILNNLDAAATAPVRRPPATSSEVIRRLETAALQHNAGEFGRILERALGISQALAERVTRDQSGEPLVIAAKALGMTAAVLQRILLFLNPVIGQSVERVHDLARLFDDLAPEAAERMLGIWRKTGMQSRPVHKPVHYEDESRGARSLATPSQQRVARGRDELPSRIKSSGR